MPSMNFFNNVLQISSRKKPGWGDMVYLVKPVGIGFEVYKRRIGKGDYKLIENLKVPDFVFVGAQSVYGDRGYLGKDKQ